MAIDLGLHCKLLYISPILRIYIKVLYSIHLLDVIWHLITISIIIIIIMIIIMNIIIIIVIIIIILLLLLLFCCLLFFIFIFFFIVHLKFL